MSPLQRLKEKLDIAIELSLGRNSLDEMECILDFIPILQRKCKRRINEWMNLDPDALIEKSFALLL